MTEGAAARQVVMVANNRSRNAIGQSKVGLGASLEGTRIWGRLQVFITVIPLDGLQVKMVIANSEPDSKGTQEKVIRREAGR